jgi:2-(3-amino-3-carboxypropyl)histidine synthase
MEAVQSTPGTINTEGTTTRNFGASSSSASSSSSLSASAAAKGASAGTRPKPRVARVKKNRIPDHILQNERLNDAIKLLPSNYNFEIHKTVWRLLSDKIEVVSLQFPEGLLMYSCIIADILKRFCNVRTIIMGDVTYGACCIDDYTAVKLGAQMLIHYGHSCLVPINVTKIPTMYVFVEIYFDPSHLVECVKRSFQTDQKIFLMGTVQFLSSLHSARKSLEEAGYGSISIPQTRPLSQGETLGCTSPLLSSSSSSSSTADNKDCEKEALIFVADGRFHLESAMIRNPGLPAFRYDPYSKVMSSEGYDVAGMKSVRMNAIMQARDAKTFGIIFGTLGRQGNIDLFNRLRRLLASHNKKAIPFLMAEINPVKLRMIENVDAWVQVSCPRLSIDWGGGYDKPMLTAYELEVCLQETQWLQVYPMDFYGADGGTWSNMYHRLNGRK